MDFPKEKNATLSVVEKIKLLRKAKGTTQGELGDIIWASPSGVSAVENGISEYTEEQLEAIKEYFGIVDMPLKEQDCIAFKKRLYIWRDYIRDLRIGEAKEMHSKMSAVVNLDPCDNDLPMLYRLFEVMLLLYDNNIDAAKEKLNYLESIKDKMSLEHLHYYYCDLGLLNICSEQYEDALKYYSQALELRKNHEDAYTEDDERLYYSIAVCYTYLERLISATISLSKVYEIHSQTRTEGFIINLDNIRAINYMKLGRFNEAKELLDRCLIYGKSMDEKFFVGKILWNLGLLNKFSKNLEAAIEYFDQALRIYEAGSDLHLWAFYHKIHCLIEYRKFSKAEKLIEEAKDLYCTNDNSTIPFESLKHLIIISKRFSQYNDESSDYIENVTIPFFKKRQDGYFTALRYYEFLAQHYEKAKRHKKLSLATKCILDIYKAIYR